MACAVTTEKMSRVPTENEFFGSHVVNGEYDAGASVSLVSGVIVNVRVFPFFFVFARDDNVPFVVCERGFPIDLV